jgi:hypothetical protein
MDNYLKEVRSKIDSLGISVIQLENPIESEQKIIIEVAPDIDNLDLLVKSFDISILFEVNDYFDSNDMILDAESKIDKRPVEVSISKFLPELNEFEKYIGRKCNSRYFAICQDQIFKIEFFEKWWIEFVQLQNGLMDELSKLEEEGLQKEADKLSQFHEKLVNELYDLISDKPFRRFVLMDKQTNRSITKYVLESIPELNQLPEDILKKEVINCIDCIKINKSMRPINKNDFISQE